MSMSVQELIDALNKVEDKSKEVLHYDFESIEEIEENDYVVLYYFLVIFLNKNLF